MYQNLKEPSCGWNVWICCLVTNFHVQSLWKPPRILQEREKNSGLTWRRGKRDERQQEGCWLHQPIQKSHCFFMSFLSLPSFFFSACPWLKIEWQSWRQIGGQLPFMQIMPFDEGEFLMCSGYNRRIKHRRPGLILLGEKLSSVITSSLHVVGRGVNSGRGFKKKMCPVRAAVVGPLLSYGACRP